MIDYDDGYIAYINGIEVARVNTDTSDEFPAYDAISTRSHRSELASRLTEPVLGVYLDKNVLRSCLKNGDNILAIHILNDNLSDNTMLSIPYLIDLSDYQYNYYDYYSRYKRLIEIDSSDLPLVSISTGENYIPVDGTITVQLGITDNGPEKYNKPTDPFNTYSGPALLKVRGQSSRDFPKQSYRIELNDENGNDTSFALLGMPKESDWILFGPFADKSQIRNKFVYDMASKLGHYNPRSRFCEVIINGQAVGLYMLTEKIKRDKNRVDIQKLQADELYGNDVTGGYILKWDKAASNSVYLRSSRQVEYPDPLQPEQKAYLDAFFHEYDSVLGYNNFLDPVIGYRKYLSDSSLVDFVIMSEIAKLSDAYLFSTYFYKDRADKDNRVKFGPMWDCDLSLGNSYFQNGNNEEGWQYVISTRLKVTRLFQDTVLVNLFQARYNQLRQTTLSNDSLFAYFDTLLKVSENARIRNYEIWPVIDKDLFGPAYSVSDFDEEIELTKSWLTRRLAWIDSHIGTLYYPIQIKPVLSVENVGVYSMNAYPNPFTDELYLSLYLEKKRNVKIEIVNLTGQVLYMREDEVEAGNYDVNLTNGTTSSLDPDIYFVRLYLDNLPVSTEKIMKR
jgi:hypothetical protein